MRVLVYEYLCANVSAELPASLALEGRAMLAAVAADMAQLPDVEVHTLWSESLGAHPFPTPVKVHKLRAGETADRERLQRVARTCDAAFVIAPECDGILAEHFRWIAETKCRWIGSDLSAISLCTDKLELAVHLAKRGVPVIPTELWDAELTQVDGLPYPLVIKPRDGAGSQATYLIQSPAHYVELEKLLLAEPMLANRNGQTGIRQPFITGRAVSVALMIDSSSGSATTLPVCEQLLSSDGRFHYRGGRVLSRIAQPELVQEIALSACQEVPGLCGYVGVDLVIADSGHNPLIVEINPRLTTSYLGYRSLAAENLANWILNPGSCPPRWFECEVQFDADGTIRR